MVRNPITRESSIHQSLNPQSIHQSAITPSPMDRALYAYMPRIFVTVATRLIATMYAAVRMSTL